MWLEKIIGFELFVKLMLILSTVLASINRFYDAIRPTKEFLSEYDSICIIQGHLQDTFADCWIIPPETDSISWQREEKASKWLFHL